MEGNIDKTPNQVLGTEIVEALISEGILTKDAAKEFQKNLIAGTVKESDWKVELESSLNKEDGK
jgi:polyhydroxyalkanoate synthesis regulator phasin